MKKILKILQSDKTLHFLLAYCITVLLQPFFIGALLSFLLIIYKEYYDKHTPGHHASWHDFMAGIGGVILGVFTILIY